MSRPAMVSVLTRLRVSRVCGENGVGLGMGGLPEVVGGGGLPG
jgi:hypothetical protein